jgi:hypothetical protein
MPLKVIKMPLKIFLVILENAIYKLDLFFLKNFYKLDLKGLLRDFSKRLSISIYKGIF